MKELLIITLKMIIYLTFKMFLNSIISNHFIFDSKNLLNDYELNLVCP